MSDMSFMIKDNKKENFTNLNHTQKVQYSLSSRILCLFFFTLWSWNSVAQIGSNTQNFPTTTTDSTKWYSPDSAKIRLLFADDPYHLKPVKSAGLSEFQQYDAIRRQDLFDAWHIGDVGSASKSVFYKPVFRQGFDMGLHAYDLYLLEKDDVRYFTTDIPYTDTYFSQHSQDDIMVKALFTSNLTKQLNGTVDYERIVQEGIYLRQQSKHTRVGVSFHYWSKNNRYRAFFSYGSNTIKREDNGGIAHDSFLVSDVEFNDRNFIDVNLNNAQTRQYKNHYALSQYFKLNAPKNSKNAFTISHHIAYQYDEYKYFDTDTVAMSLTDSTFYGELRPYGQELRHFLAVRQMENKVMLGMANFRFGKDSIPQLNNRISVGLKHKIHWVNQEPNRYTVNNLFLVGNWLLTPREGGIFHGNINGHIALADNAGDYRIGAKGVLNIKKLGALDVRFVHRRYTPSLMQQSFFVSQLPIWENDFVPTIETSIEAAYGLPKIGFEVRGRYHLVNNLLYYDTLSFPQQTSDIVNIAQLFITQNFTFWKKLHFDNTIVLQRVTDDILRFPNIATKHSLYWEGKIFKKAMLARVGVDARWYSDYYGDAYQPLTGQFHQQNEVKLSFYPIADLFFNMEVQRFRAFFKWENVPQLFIKESYLTAPLHPARDNAFRFGIAWSFLD